MKFRYALLILGFALASCGQAPATDTALTPTIAVGASIPDLSEHGPGKDAVVIEHDAAAVLVTLDLMRGHLIASLENAKLGDYALAQEHAAQPLTKHYQPIKSLVQESAAAADAELEAAFKAYHQHLASKADVATIEQSKAAVEAQIDQIESVLVPIHTDVHSRALAGVMTTAAAEYGASIKDGAFATPLDYQHAFGLTRVAETHFARLKPELSLEAAQTTQSALVALVAAMPTLQLPSVVTPADKLVSATSSAADQLGTAQAMENDTESP